VDIFVYGTLTDRETAAQILESVESRGRAVLDGLHRVDGAYPTLLPGGRVEGRILAVPDIEPLDRYEGVEQGLYIRIEVPTKDGGTVETYIGEPTRLGLQVEWPGTGPFERRVRRFVTDQSVVVEKL